MYYPPEIVEQVIAANDIVAVVGSCVQLKRSGSGYMGLCPFHSEKTPSFSVSPSRQTFHCFGCGEGGNVVTFLMKYENDSFQEALKILADRASITLPEAEQSEDARKKSAQRGRLLEINRESAAYYYRLLRSPKGKAGLAYFAGRGLDRNTLQSFGLGYADGARSDLTAHLRQKGYADEDILAAGVAAFDEKRGLHDKFWNRVMFPIMDPSNRVIGFGGRVMGDGKPKYLNSPETPVFDKSRNLYGLNLAKKSRCGYFILCEGYMDVIAMHQAGFSQAIASLGTAFTPGQAVILRRYVKEVLLAYDSDGAGVRAAVRNIEILRDAGLTGRVVNLKPFKDPDEFIRGLGTEEFQKRLDQAENSFYFQIRQVASDYSMSDPAQRTEFYHELAKRLCGFGDEIERDSYIKAMAAEYYIDESLLRREVDMYAKVYGPDTAPGTGTSRGRPAGMISGPAGSRGQEPRGISRSRDDFRANGRRSAGAGVASGRSSLSRGDGSEGESAENAGNLKSAGAPESGRDIPSETNSESNSETNGVKGEISGSIRRAGAGEHGASHSAAQRSELQGERLLLTWIADDPGIYPQIRHLISAEDFSEGIDRAVAERYFDLLGEETGDALAVVSGNAGRVHSSPAMVIASFEDGDQQREVAGIFETRLPGVGAQAGGKEREKALRDILAIVKRGRIRRLSESMTDAGCLQQLMRAKKDLETIRTMPLRLTE